MVKAIVIIQFVVAFAYFLMLSRKNRVQAGCEAIIVLLLPVFGLIFFLVVRLSQPSMKAEDPSYVYQDFTHDQLYLKGLLPDESNIVPVVDALLMDDTLVKRTILSDVIKRNVLNNYDILHKALKDEDSEVAHYAVSLVTHRVAELEAVLYQMQQRVSTSPKNVDILFQYADMLELYLTTNMQDEQTQKRFRKIHADILENILLLNSTEKKYFIQKIEREIQLKNFNKAELYCKKFLEVFSNKEEPFLMYAKLYYVLGDYCGIRKIIQELKASKIQFSNRALQFVRFWDGGDQYVS